MDFFPFWKTSVLRRHDSARPRRRQQPLLLTLSCAEQDLADSISDMSKGNDWFLVAPDFTDYLRAQARPHHMSYPHFSGSTNWFWLCNTA